MFFFFFFNDPATTEIYTLSLTTLFRSMATWRRQPTRPWEAEITTWLPGSTPQWPAVRSTPPPDGARSLRSEEHTSELQSQFHLVCRLLLEKKKKKTMRIHNDMLESFK